MNSLEAQNVKSAVYITTATSCDRIKSILVGFKAFCRARFTVRQHRCKNCVICNLALRQSAVPSGTEASTDQACGFR
ncbi:MAG: hypothetical protein ACKESB_00395 [Candidatus Hodgkinia cicadicola]